MTLGEHIAELRNAHGISQADLAEAMEVSRQSVSKWETGASTPDLEKLVKLADYFNLTLDQLVKGKDQETFKQPDVAAEATIKSSPAPHRTKAQSLGILFLCLSGFASILFAILFGVWGLVFVTPFLLFGLICFFVKTHPILKAVWTDYIILSLFFHYCTGIHPSHILLTFRWTYQMNYAILVFSWIWFLIIVALVIGTAAVFRNKGWSWTPKQIGELVFGLLLYALSHILGAFVIHFGNFTYWIYLLTAYLQLAGLTIVVTDITRWFVSKRAKQF